MGRETFSEILELGALLTRLIRMDSSASAAPSDIYNSEPVESNEKTVNDTILDTAPIPTANAQGDENEPKYLSAWQSLPNGTRDFYTGLVSILVAITRHILILQNPGG
jgi:hypothetical protein